MRPDPIDFDSPLGISKREWVKVLGVNLALLLIVYTVALICTLCGNDIFLLKFFSEELQRIEDTLRGWNIYPIVEIAYSCIETFAISTFSTRKFPKWYFILGLLVVRILSNVLFTNLLGAYPSFIPFVINVVFVIVMCCLQLKQLPWWKLLLRAVIAVAVSFCLNGLINAFRTSCYQIWNYTIGNSTAFVLNVEYIIALAFAYLFIDVISVHLKTKGGTTQCLTNPTAGGSSPSTMKCSPKPSKIATNNLPPKYRKRLRLLKAKVIAIQTIGLIVIAALPWFTGRPVEFALVYASFCITRLMLGFNRSLHFKSEMVCVTSGALAFWALTFLTPNVETSIILSLGYGAGLALGFRLYWELHDLMMYHKAAKTDRYAMFYTVFKGNCDPKHVNGVMRAKGYADKDEIKMVQMYMQKEKVEYIAEYLTFAKITIEKKLTDIANDLYSRR